jgi:uncharacterized protein (TIRG00374 family)
MKLPLKLAITVILLGVIVWQLEDLRQVGQLLVRIDPLYVLLILILNTFDRALMTYKWRRLLRSRGQHLPFFRGLRIYCAAMVWGKFLPATIGADAVRAFSTSRTGLAASEVVASIVVERMIGFIAGLLLGLLSLSLLLRLGILDARFNLVWWLWSLSIFATMLVFATSLSQTTFDFIHGRLLQGRLLQGSAGARVTQRLRKLHLTYLAYRDEKSCLTLFFGLTVVEQFMPILQAWVIALALGVEVSLLYIAVAVPPALLISHIPISIDGLGVFEGAFMLLISLGGVTAAEAIAIALTGRILELVSWLPWWMAHVIGDGKLRPPKIVVEGG